MTEILYFQGPLSTFLFHIPQKTYFFTHRFWWGTEKDTKAKTEAETEAVKWFLKAAEQGHAEAQAVLALCYSNGQGVPKDINLNIARHRASGIGDK